MLNIIWGQTTAKRKKILAKKKLCKYKKSYQENQGRYLSS